jgi:hypothetical protein
MSIYRNGARGLQDVFYPPPTSFEAAKLVFGDPLHISRQDRTEDGELRWQTIGMVADVALLLVAHTWEDTVSDGEHIRIISARRATKLERKVYEQGP